MREPFVEPAPLGTAGAIRYAGESLRESVVVFNGDVLTEVDLSAVIALHRERKAKATIVLTPVENKNAQLRVLPRTGFLIAYDDPVGLAREIVAFCG